MPVSLIYIARMLWRRCMFITLSLNKFDQSGKLQMSKPLLVFDVDGTLTKARLKITDEMKQFMVDVRKKGVPLAVVGGSDLSKIVEQLGDSLEDVLSRYDYVFSENGLVGFKGTIPLPTRSIHEELGEKRLQTLINWTLAYFSQMQLPCKRGNFIEFRKGMLNLCPVGRSCSYDERLAFAAHDEKHGIRARLVEELEKKFADYGLEFAVGGQISVDVYPKGWDKTYCLQFLQEYPVIHFFGDKTSAGGNDYAIFEHPKTVGHTVRDPDETRSQVQALIDSL